MSTLRFSFSSLRYCALFVAAIAFVCLSPKWVFFPAAWIAPAGLLYFVRRSSYKQTLRIAYPLLIVATAISQYQVAPLPTAAFLFFVVLSSLLSLLPYLLDKLLKNAFTGFAATFVFPAIAVILEYGTSFGPWGAWGAIANTQFPFTPFIQIASVTGFWGISFLIYWSAAVIHWLIENRIRGYFPKTGFLIWAGCLSNVLVFGFLRILFAPAVPTVKIGGVTASNLPALECMYQDATARSIHIPISVSQSSPLLQEANRGLVAFIENPNPEKFKRTFTVLDSHYNQLFRLSSQKATQGAKIIVWSEAAALLLKNQEAGLLHRGKSLAAHHQVYLLMAMGVLTPGKITPERKFLENKIVIISPGGKIIRTYHKNVPVPGVEPSKPGNGQIPVIATPFGKISPAICYDADFPSLMRQTGQQGTDLLLIPAGDWKAISPYHTYAAVFRGIENGCTVIRQTNGGLSVVADPYGRICAQSDFFTEPRKTMLADAPARATFTLYRYLGDGLPFICLFFWVLSLGKIIFKHQKNDSQRHSSVAV